MKSVRLCDTIMFWNMYTVSLVRIKDPLGTFNHFSLENFVNIIKTINKTIFLNFCFLARIVLHFLNRQVLHAAVSYYKKLSIPIIH